MFGTTKGLGAIVAYVTGGAVFDSDESEKRLEVAVLARKQVAGLVRSTSIDGLSPQSVGGRLARSIARAVDLFDDAYHLCTDERLTSAMVLARSFVEQVAYTARIRHISSDCQSDPFELESRLSALDKSSEQKQRFFRQKSVDPNQIYTGAALEKVGFKTPVTRTEDLIISFQWALSTFGDTEGKARLIYSALSEWSHPTLFSVVHCYSKNVPPTQTSLGLLEVGEIRRAYIRWSLAQMILVHILWTTRAENTLNSPESAS